MRKEECLMGAFWNYFLDFFGLSSRAVTRRGVLE
jgi:hypothetical protein